MESRLYIVALPYIGILHSNDELWPVDQSVIRHFFDTIIL